MWYVGGTLSSHVCSVPSVACRLCCVSAATASSALHSVSSAFSTSCAQDGSSVDAARSNDELPEPDTAAPGTGEAAIAMAALAV